MLRPRIIPCLLVRNGGLVKTMQFGKDKYVGDPLNAVRIFNEKEVDELIVLDLDATTKKREPDYTLIKNLAAECRMPLCYGGGVTSVEQFDKIVSLGVEKVSINAAAIRTPDLITKSAEIVGSQSVVVSIDSRKNLKTGAYEGWIQNGTVATGKSVVDLAQDAERLGAGEIVINSIDNDGMMKGYDFNLIKLIRNATKLPMSVLGGAGSAKDIASLIAKFGIIGAGAGSLFVFKGVYRAVLINYPNREEKAKLLA